MKDFYMINKLLREKIGCNVRKNPRPHVVLVILLSECSINDSLLSN